MSEGQWGTGNGDNRSWTWQGTTGPRVGVAFTPTHRQIFDSILHCYFL